MSLRKLTYILWLFVLGIFVVVSCGKDPVFEQGDYIYENDDFTKVENINGVIIHWAEDMVICEEQKNVIRNLVANMVRVEGGTFQMGAQHTDAMGDNYDAEAQDDEAPVHEVTLGGYYIGKYEITQQEWRAVMGYDLDWSEQYGVGERMPAYNVSRADALQFVAKLSAMTRLNFNLPTEAQWEFAARGGNNSQHYRFSGSNSVDDVAWHRENAQSMVHPAGTKQANELGLYDMSGNVWEWCLDAYGPYPGTPQTNPVSYDGDGFVLRGGGWTYFPVYSRVACRDGYNGSARSVSNGFRVVMN